MSRWRQVGGDMTWERHGVVLARNEPTYRQVHLARITPWLEHDREAAVTQGLYLVDEKTVDLDDLAIASSEVQGALRSAGISAADYETLAPEQKADVLASYAGYEDSRSVDRLAEALPARPADIEFWGGKETAENLETYDQELRREALDANFETRLTFGKLPSLEAIEFAMGGQPFEMDLKGRDALALAFAVACAGGSGSTETAEDFVGTVEALASAPPPNELKPGELASRLERILADWEERYGDASDEEEGIAARAQSLASSMLGAIGFEWI